jgi:Domain of unknown function (DUF4118)
VSEDVELAVGWGVAAFGPLAATTVMTALRDQPHATGFAVVALVFVIGAAAVLAGPRAAGVATVTAALSFDFLLVRPFLELKIDTDDSLWPVLVLVASGSSIVYVAHRRWPSATRSPLSRPGSQANESRRIERIALLIEQGADPRDLISAVEAELTALLLARRCRFEPGEAADSLPRIERDGTIAGRPSSLPLPPEDIELPVRWQGRWIGRFVITPTGGASVPPENWIVAVILADHLAAAVTTRKPTAPN